MVRTPPLIIFDLDGTLADSKLDLFAAVNHVRARWDLAPLAEAAIAGMIGDGAAMLVRRALGAAASETMVAAGLQAFLAYYGEHMLDRTRLYDGVAETLAGLGACQLAVLTNKPYRFSRRMLRGLGIDRHFLAIYGGNSFAEKKPSPVGIHHILSEAGGRPETTWMVGDSAIDVATGRNAGVRTCGVTYGYAPESFVRTPPDRLVHSFPEIAELPLLMS